jgi:hypothetical protein
MAMTKWVSATPGGAEFLKLLDTTVQVIGPADVGMVKFLARGHFNQGIVADISAKALQALATPSLSAEVRMKVLGMKEASVVFTTGEPSETATTTWELPCTAFIYDAGAR